MSRSWKQWLVIAAIVGMTLPLVALAQDEPVTLTAVGFVVAPEEIGTPLDQAYQKFLTDFQSANTNVTINAIETPPEFDTQLLTDLAAGTAPDVWSQDASTLSRLIDSGNVLDMRECMSVEPNLTTDRFFPNTLAIHEPEGADGPIYGLPNDFTPMVMYYNPESFTRAGLDMPTSDWTWDQFLETAQKLTLDSQGKNSLDPDFDASNVVQYGVRVRQYTFEWIYWVWQNGGDVISPDGTTVDGYLNSPESIEAIQFWSDLVTKYHVSPDPTSLADMTQQAGFLPVFLDGAVAIFPRGHWELVGLRNQDNYEDGRLAVVGNPSNVEDVTVIYESGWVINAAVASDPAKLEAACKFVDAATSLEYQETKNITSIAIAANQEAAQEDINNTQYPAIEQVFVDEVANGRAPYGAKYAIWPVLETRLDLMMENILAGNSVEDEIQLAVEDLDRELERASR